MEDEENIPDEMKIEIGELIRRKIKPNGDSREDLSDVIIRVFDRMYSPDNPISGSVNRSVYLVEDDGEGDIEYLRGLFDRGIEIVKDSTYRIDLASFVGFLGFGLVEDVLRYKESLRSKGNARLIRLSTKIPRDEGKKSSYLRLVREDTSVEE